MRKTRIFSMNRFIKNAAANALLAAIALGLFLALGMRADGAMAVNASPPGIVEGLRTNTEIYRGRKGSKAALLIPVSWDAGALDDILETLRNSGCRATFAMSFSFASSNPEKVRRIVLEGHEPAVMADEGAAGLGNSELRAEFERTAARIESVSGKLPSLCFTGRLDGASGAARGAGLTAVKGSIDLLCERGDASDISSRASGNIRGGDIVVCAPTAAFENALADILKYFSSVGLTAATVSGTIYD